MVIVRFKLGKVVYGYLFPDQFIFLTYQLADPSWLHGLTYSDFWRVSSLS